VDNSPAYPSSGVLRMHLLLPPPPPYQNPHTSTLPFLPSHAVALHSPTIQAGAMTRYSKFEVELPAGHGQVGQKLLERDVSIAVMCVRNRHCLPRCLAGPPQEYNACLAGPPQEYNACLAISHCSQPYVAARPTPS